MTEMYIKKIKAGLLDINDLQPYWQKKVNEELEARGELLPGEEPEPETPEPEIVEPKEEEPEPEQPEEPETETEPEPEDH